MYDKDAFLNETQLSCRDLSWTISLSNHYLVIQSIMLLIEWLLFMNEYIFFDKGISCFSSYLFICC